MKAKVDAKVKTRRAAMMKKIVWLAVGQAGTISYQQLADILPDAMSQKQYNEQLDSVLLLLSAMGIDLVETLDDEYAKNSNSKIVIKPSGQMEKMLAQFCQSELDLQHATLSQSYYYASLPLCVIDAVYSIGARYTSTENTVEYYCNVVKTQRFRAHGSVYPSISDQRRISDLITDASHHTNAAQNLFGNEQRTSSKNGILKADATRRFAECLARHGIEVFQDITHAMSDNLLEAEIRLIPGQKSGISWSYFLMLAGSDDFIKPDRMILRFIQRATGQMIPANKAQSLLHGVLKLLSKKFPNLTLRGLDHEIWKKEQSRKKT